ncbi:unnamed protein product [Cylindrotheca closterium]|uniref:PNPLA domain-containing protein n=1 Tax=Cylindrotheca closterium TaxID=2856 RepID=A0AAD2G4M0_9STRA|nr:unnamed protein product [Cylindrotheca closterium]
MRISSQQAYAGGVFVGVMRMIGTVFKVLLCFFAIYRLLAWPPLHWFYDPVSHAGPGTIYIPGGGFSGFWFHLGYLQSMKDLHEYEYYCFSSACLGILAVLMDHTADDVMDAALLAQERWQDNHISRFDLVENFLETLVPTSDDDSHDQEQLQQILSKIKILVTTTENGVEVLQATNRDELLDLMIKTTWVPALTGWGFLTDHKDVYLDGGFSRYLHPDCEYVLELPMVWETLVHTFTPSLTRETIRELWNVGYEYEYGFQGLSKQAKEGFLITNDDDDEEIYLQRERNDTQHNDTSCRSETMDSVQSSSLLQMIQ